MCTVNRKIGASDLPGDNNITITIMIMPVGRRSV